MTFGPDQSLEQPLLRAKEKSPKEESLSRSLIRSLRRLSRSWSATAAASHGVLSTPLSAAQVFGHLAAQSLFLRGVQAALWLLGVAALFCLVAALPCPSRRRGRFAFSVDLFVACFRALVALGSHLVAPLWILIGLLALDPDLQEELLSWVPGMGTKSLTLLVGEDEMKSLVGVFLVFLVRGPQLPWWEGLLMLAVWLALLGLQGEHPKEACMWVPALLFVLSLVDKKAKPGGRPRRSSTRSSYPGADKEDETQSSNSVEEEYRRSSALRGAVTSLPDWSPPTHKEVRQWREAFHLNEELLGVYVCSVRGKWMHQGRLYISLAHVCFHDVAIFKNALHFALPLDNLSEIVLGNLSGGHGRREDGMLVLKQPLLIKGMKEPVTTIEVQGCNRGLQALAALFGLEALCDDDEEPKGSESDNDMPSLQAAWRKAGLTTTPDKVSQLFDDGEGGKPFHKIMEAHVPNLELSEVLDELLAEEWHETSMLRLFLTEMGASDMKISPWVDESDESDGPTVKIREVTLTMPCTPAPMCPKATEMSMIYRLSVDSREPCCFTVDTSSIAHDVPFGGNFLVQERMKLGTSGSGGADMVKSCRVVFLKSCGLLNGRIQSITMSEQTKCGDVLVGLLRQRDPQVQPDRPGEAVYVISVWELQRRTTLFHSDWRAPFLPHDGGKRWRWVDDSFSKHHMLATGCDRERSALADAPPLEPWRGWTSDGEWSVKGGANDDGPTDEEGWQYAVDFFRSGVLWLEGSRGFHCRRRLWTCTFIPALVPQSPGAPDYEAREARAAQMLAASGRSPSKE